VGIFLNQINEVQDIEVLFDEKLIFNYHVKFIENKTIKLLGFITSYCKHFNNVNALRHVYCFYIRSNLNCCSLV